MGREGERERGRVFWKYQLDSKEPFIDYRFFIDYTLFLLAVVISYF